jgi:hypothetical protein
MQDSQGNPAQRTWRLANLPILGQKKGRFGAWLSSSAKANTRLGSSSSASSLAICRQGRSFPSFKGDVKTHENLGCQSAESVVPICAKGT